MAFENCRASSSPLSYYFIIKCFPPESCASPVFFFFFFCSPAFRIGLILGPTELDSAFGGMSTHAHLACPDLFSQPISISQQLLTLNDFSIPRTPPMTRPSYQSQGSVIRERFETPGEKGGGGF